MTPTDPTTKLIENVFEFAVAFLPANYYDDLIYQATRTKRRDQLEGLVAIYQLNLDENRTLTEQEILFLHRLVKNMKKELAVLIRAEKATV